MLVVAGSFLIGFLANRWWTIAIPVTFCFLWLARIDEATAVIGAFQAVAAFSIGLLARRRWWNRRRRPDAD